MTSFRPPAVPDLHAPFIQGRLPDFFKHSTPADFKRLRNSHLSEQEGASAPDHWFNSASEVERQVLLDYQARRRHSRNTLAVTLKSLKGIGEFAEPLLQARIAVGLGVLVDLNKDEFVQITREPEMIGSMLRTVPQRQSLMQAALQNFAREVGFEAGTALAPKDAFSLELIPDGQGAYPRFRYRYREQLPIEPARFARLCHDLDLGGQYQRHLQHVFDTPATRGRVHEQSVAAFKDQLRVDVQIAFLKEDIGPSARQTLLELLGGERAPRFNERPVRCWHLSMFGIALAQVLLISGGLGRGDSAEPLLVYLPGAPSSPLKEYPSAAAAIRDLRIKLRSPDYQALLRRYAPKVSEAHVMRRLEEALYHQVRQPSGVYERQPDPNGNLYLGAEPIEVELFGHLQERHVEKLKADARILAVPSADADEQARTTRLAYWESTGFNLLNAVAFFIPGLDLVMAAVAAEQLFAEVVDGLRAWEEGELDEAWTVFEAVGLNIALIAGLGLAGHRLSRATSSELMDGLVQVRRPDGQVRLWKPDLKPYAVEVDLENEVCNAQGVYAIAGKYYLRLNGTSYEIALSAGGEWRILHPANPEAYQPQLRHNGRGAWVAKGELPLSWSRRQLLCRMGPVTERLEDIQLAQAADISGISDDMLRRMYVESTPVPPLLEDTLRRLRLDDSIGRMIDLLRSAQSGELNMGFCARLAIELPGWPRRVIEVFEGPTLTGTPTVYGRQLWPEGRSIKVLASDLFDNRLPEAIVAQLDESEIDQLLGAGVAPDARAQAVREKMARRIIRRRKTIFETLYDQGHAPKSSRARLLKERFTSLPDEVVDELLSHASGLEAGDERIPLTLAEEARLYQRQVRLSRALEGLHRPTMATRDSDRLTLRLMEKLPNWDGRVRFELRRDTADGRLLEQVGEMNASLKRTLVREHGSYTVFDVEGQALARSESMAGAILTALPGKDRVALGIDLPGQPPLQALLYRLAIDDRVQASRLLGQQPVRPGFRSPLRLADGRLGYPLGGVQSTQATARRLSELYPDLNRRQIQALKARLSLSNEHLGTAIEALEHEYEQLARSLRDWQLELQISSFELEYRWRVGQRLKAAWRLAGDGERTHILDLSGQRVSRLPVLRARFDHIKQLNMESMGLDEVPESFLGRFGELRELILLNNNLSSVPEAVAHLASLSTLDLSSNALTNSLTVFEPLRSLHGLQSLNLSSNRLSSFPAQVLRDLCSLPSLCRLSIRFNGLALSAGDLDILSALPLERLSLGSNRIVLDAAAAQAFTRFSHLRVLSLSSNPLGLAPDVSNMVLLQHLDLESCAITGWPEGLSRLMNLHRCRLRQVELSSNFISEIPELATTRFAEVLRESDSNQSRLHVNYNPLLAESVARLEATGSVFHASGQFQHSSLPWLVGSSAAQRELWSEMFVRRGNMELMDVLDRLAESREYSINKTGLNERVWALLEFSSQHDELREELVEIARCFPFTCGDAGTDAFSELETTVLVYRLGVEAGNNAELGTTLVQLFRQLFRRHEVQRLSELVAQRRVLRRRALVRQETLPDLAVQDDISDGLLLRATVDDIEIRLALRQGLAKALNYPELSTGMLYREEANISKRTIMNIRDAVLVNETAANRQQWMAGDASWQRYLKRRFSVQFEAVVAPWAEGLEYLEYCAQIYQGPIPTLEREVLEVLSEALGESPLDAQGALRRVELSGQRYLDVVNAVRDAHRKAEVDCISRLTKAEDEAVEEL
ncbi:dermonecrotic toxin domain-containing protein [Pseudomonas sp. 5P_5.1_Bac1]|uniref:dermonecrotic toxin domain-containing protein n=1 Tax=Pseudomonas sp. 5P_5.1_Bac1 TaxID=2971616 RepID=UPI0021CAE2F2|nr:DUF6543 domain-containing protein [Pseudomonas sp. 5P_5.1_Bac1]MCU1722675.1 hypothetical protein [Pseudomonas sp. 5P_5.1_Bac1]